MVNSRWHIDGGHHVRWFAGLSLAVALLAAYALLATSPLQAQTTPQTTTTTLVGNICEKDQYDCYMFEYDLSASGTIAQSFTTGSETGGYPILEIRLMLRVGAGRSTNIMIKEDNNGKPGTLVATLTNPDSFTDDILHSFAAPENTTLAPDKTYWITVNEGIQSIAQGVTVLTIHPWVGERGEAGWSIGDERLKRSADMSDWNSRQSALVLEIKSTEGAVTASSDASLRSMYIFPSPNRADAGGRIWLRPEFRPGITEYTGNVVNWVDRVRIDADKRDIRASSVFSVGQSPDRENYATFAVDHGTNTVTVTVTAEDGSTKTYTITLERSADPPEPTDCPTDTTWCATMASSYFRSIGVDRGGSPRLFEGAGYSVYGVDGDMSSRKFDHGGHRYTVLRLDWYRHSSPDGHTAYIDYLRFGAEPALPFGSVLQVDDRTFTLDGDNDTRHPGHHSWWILSNPFDWELGDHVTVSVKLPDSDNADLGDLALTDADDNPISLTPDEFDRNVTDYTALVANAIGSVTLAATPKDSNATVVITNDDDTSTPGEAALDIDVGSNNVLSVVVTSQSGDATKTYTVTVSRAATQLQSANHLPTGAPTISGTAQVGQTLTAITSGIDDADGLVNASFDYQWQRQDLANDTVTDIPGETGATYVLTSDDRDGAVRVSVSFSDDTGNSETLSSYWLLLLTRPNNPPTGALTISGVAQIGETLTADTSSIADADGLTNATYGYQWIASNGSSDVEIANATAPTYTVAAEVEGWAIQVRVSFTDDAGNGESLTSAATGAVSFAVQPQIANSAATGIPIISGDPQVGETLTADSSGIADADGLTNASYSYQWIINDGSSDTDITGATDSSYTVTAAAEGRTIRVSVTFTDDAGTEESLSSAATALVQPRPAPDGPPDAPNRQEGTAVFVGGVDLEWNDVFGAESYDVRQYRSGQWTDLPGDGVEIAFYGAGAIISGLDPESSLWFQVRAANAHGVSDWSEMLYTGSTSQYKLGRQARPDNVPASGAPVMHGTAQVGESLWVDTTGIEDGNGLDRVQFQYQWTSNDGDADTDIAGATDSGYTLVAADVGKTIRVRVAFTDRGGYSEIRTSVATGAVSPAVQQQTAINPATWAEPAITGAAQVGEKLQADTSGITDDDGLTNSTFNYQWVANDGGTDADISGETDSAYTLVADDVGKTIKVRVTFTDDAGNEEALISAATDEVGFAVQQQGASNTQATGEPTINAAAQVGETLTADTSGIADADGLTNVSYSYQWVAGGTDLGGATGSTYALTASEQGEIIQVRVSFTDDAGNQESLTSAATEAVAAKPNTSATGRPTTGGTAQVGETLTADTTGIGDADGLTNVSYSYQWVAGGTDLGGATGSTYALTAGEQGKTIRVRVSFTDDAGNRETLTSAATDEVAAKPNSPATGQPIISGTVRVGDMLTADTSGIADADGLDNVSYRYQWVRNDGSSDTGITDATASAYTLVDADEGQTLKVRVTFTDDVGHDETLTSASTAAIAAEDPQSQEPPAKPTGLTATVSHDSVSLTWDDPGDESITGYQILRRDRALHAIGEFLVHVDDTGNANTTFTDNDVEPSVQYVYRIKAKNNAGLSELSEWVRANMPAPTRDPNSPATGVPTVTGTAQVGEVLTADTSGIADADGLENATFSYQWIRNDGSTETDIQDATGSIYTLVDADEGQTIKVKVSFTDDAGNEETLTSTATGSVAARPNTSATGRPTISGPARVGETLTADTTGIADADGLTNVSYGYQWVANDGTSDADIGGATGSTYTLTASEQGQTIQVRVSFTDDAGNETTLTSAATEAVAAKPNSLATGEPSISGPARVGETLTVDTSGIADADGLDNVSYRYQWVVTDRGAYFDISGETGATYTLVAADRGLYIQVRVSFTDDAGKRETLTSALTDVVAAAP